MPVLHTSGTNNPTWQVDEIRIRPTSYDAEVITVDAFADSGSFELFYYEYYYGEYIKRAATITAGATASSFKNALAGLPNINNYGPAVTREDLDANGAVTTDPSAVEGHRYQITIARFRDQTIALPSKNIDNLVAGNVAASVTI